MLPEGEYSEPGQWIHSSSPSVSLYLPDTHAVQAIESVVSSPAWASKPGAQKHWSPSRIKVGAHCIEFAIITEPVTQSVDRLLPAGE